MSWIEERVGSRRQEERHYRLDISPPQSSLRQLYYCSLQCYHYRDDGYYVKGTGRTWIDAISGVAHQQPHSPSYGIGLSRVPRDFQLSTSRLFFLDASCSSCSFFGVGVFLRLGWFDRTRSFFTRSFFLELFHLGPSRSSFSVLALSVSSVLEFSYLTFVSTNRFMSSLRWHPWFQSVARLNVCRA